jgi:hypothetical protein
MAFDAGRQPVCAGGNVGPVRTVRTVIVTIACVVLVVAVVALVHVGDGSAGFEVGPAQPAQSAPLAGGGTVGVATPIVVTIAGTRATHGVRARAALTP